MAKGSRQKLKLYYLSQIMIKKTDDEHALTMPEILNYLEADGVTADRKSIYDDFEVLRDLGLDIIGEKKGRGYYYHVGSKRFEIAELTLLVDAIQSSKFITAKKSADLIKKLTDLASEHEAKQLKRQVVVQGRIKTMNESIYYIVDDLHRAILENKIITFQYLTWNVEKKLVPRRDRIYTVSPWALIWDDENYYLVGYDEDDAKIKHFRVDKIKDIVLLDNKRNGREEFEKADIGTYTKVNFGMFGAKETTMVSISFENQYAGLVIDRFGKEIPIKPSKQEGWSDTRVEVMVSDQFFGWIFAMGGKVRITGPADVFDRYKEELNKQLKDYN